MRFTTFEDIYPFDTKLDGLELCYNLSFNADNNFYRLNVSVDVDFDEIKEYFGQADYDNPQLGLEKFCEIQVTGNGVINHAMHDPRINFQPCSRLIKISKGKYKTRTFIVKPMKEYGKRIPYFGILFNYLNSPLYSISLEKLTGWSEEKSQKE